jgi:hypothetical protein
MWKCCVAIFAVVSLSVASSGQTISKYRSALPLGGYNMRGYSDNPFGSSAGYILYIPNTATVSIVIWDLDEHPVF